MPYAPLSPAEAASRVAVGPDRSRANHETWPPCNVSKAQQTFSPHLAGFHKPFTICDGYSTVVCYPRGALVHQRRRRLGTSPPAPAPLGNAAGAASFAAPAAASRALGDAHRFRAGDTRRSKEPPPPPPTSKPPGIKFCTITNLHRPDPSNTDFCKTQLNGSSTVDVEGRCSYVAYCKPTQHFHVFGTKGKGSKWDPFGSRTIHLETEKSPPRVTKDAAASRHLSRHSRGRAQGRDTSSPSDPPMAARRLHYIALGDCGGCVGGEGGRRLWMGGQRSLCHPHE